MSDVRELLPFWVNGSLEGAERAEVEKALAGSAGLRAEVAELQALRQNMRADAVSGGPGDLGLARLMRAIDAETAPRAVSGGRSDMGRLAASVAVAAVMSSLLTYGVMQSGQTDAPVYEQASGEDPGAALIVTFQPESTEAAISALLREKGLVIVDGPSAIGLYRIGLPVDMTGDDAARYLTAATSIIATVELTE
jgi:hypothetical protein